MEEKLKTLGEIIDWINILREDDEYGVMSSDNIAIVEKNNLQQEAIKWIKALEFAKPFGFEGTITWIKQFFNITEEDLK